MRFSEAVESLSMRCSAVLVAEGAEFEECGEVGVVAVAVVVPGVVVVMSMVEAMPTFF